jgi:L-serine deaminase
VNEENASGRIITAPTNGASGVIPAVLMYAQTFTKFNSQEDIIRFLLVAGEIGTLLKRMPLSPQQWVVVRQKLVFLQQWQPLD